MGRQLCDCIWLKLAKMIVAAVLVFANNAISRGVCKFWCLSDIFIGICMDKYVDKSFRMRAA